MKKVKAIVQIEQEHCAGCIYECGGDCYKRQDDEFFDCEKHNCIYQLKEVELDEK